MADILKHLDLNSADGTQLNLDALYQVVPSAFTEVRDDKTGEISRKVNFEVLRRLLGDHATDGDGEMYQFTWVGKNAARAEAAKPTDKTLRPVVEDSVDWDNTKNIYVEGDNLEVLKLLQRSYMGKVKMIYIDPPYNTGNDFVYHDDFAHTAAEEDFEAGNVDELGYRFRKNTDTNGKFHSDWCSMIYPRLLLARNLLSEDGVIFISIDDYEVRNMKIICDEIFGEGNFIAQLIWERAYSPKNDAKYVSVNHDYVLFYSKSIEHFKIGRLPRTEEANSRYSNPDNDPRGPWLSDNLTVKTYSPKTDYPITTPAGRIVNPPKGRCWRMSKVKYDELLNEQRLWFGSDGNGVPRLKRFLSELKHDGLTPSSILFYKDVGHSQEGAKETSKILGGGYFNGPKPTRLLKFLLTLGNPKNDSIVLDFFSGSASTADAIFQFNLENSKNLKFIMVQVPEVCDRKSTAFANGYNNICDIGKDRINKVETILKSKYSELDQIDIGFRDFKIDSSNMKDVYYNPEKLNQDLLSSLESNVKEDRTDYDLLFSTILDLGLTLDKEVKEETIGNTKVYIYNDDEKEGPDLIACFADNITEDVITAIAKRNPLKAVFKDSSFENSPSKINLFELFKTYANISDDNELQSRVRVI